MNRNDLRDLQNTVKHGGLPCPDKSRKDLYEWLCVNYENISNCNDFLCHILYIIHRDALMKAKRLYNAAYYIFILIGFTAAFMYFYIKYTTLATENRILLIMCLLFTTISLVCALTLFLKKYALQDVINNNAIDSETGYIEFIPYLSVAKIYGIYTMFTEKKKGVKDIERE